MSLLFSAATVIRIPALLMSLRDGELRIPRFQRDFVWTDEQRLALFDSIYRGLPTGSLLVWSTVKHQLPFHPTIGPFALRAPPQTARRRREQRYYLIDGLQRASTLFLGLGAAFYEATERSADDDERAVVFDLVNEEFQLKTEDDDPTLLPLSLVLDTKAFFRFLNRLEGEEDAKILGNRAESLAARLRDYTIPLTPLLSEDLAQVTVAFKRINTTGTPMGEEHVLRTLCFSPNFDLSEALERHTEEIERSGFLGATDIMLLQVAKSALGLDIDAEDAEETAALLKRQPEVLDRAKDSLLRAAAFLREHCDVHGRKALPYDLQAVLIAAVMSTNALRPAEVEVLRTWFWRTTYLESLTGVTGVHLARILRTFGSRLDFASRTGEAQSFAPGRMVLPLAVRNASSPRFKAFELLLASQRPWTGTNEPPGRLVATYGSTVIRQIARRPFSAPENLILVHPAAHGRLLAVLLDSERSAEAPELRGHELDGDPEKWRRWLLDDKENNVVRHRREQLQWHELALLESVGLAYPIDLP